MLLGQIVSFQSSFVCWKLDCSSAGCICTPSHMTTDWIFCSAAQIPLNWNFKWKLSRFAADQRITWKHVMSHGDGSGPLSWSASSAPYETSTIIHCNCLCILHYNSWEVFFNAHRALQRIRREGAIRETLHTQKKKRYFSNFLLLSSLQINLARWWIWNANFNYIFPQLFLIILFQSVNTISVRY